MSRPSRLTRQQRDIQRAITVALATAHENRRNERKYRACIEYAARHIDAARLDIDTIEPSDRASI